jgi:hypothetical protein
MVATVQSILCSQHILSCVGCRLGRRGQGQMPTSRALLLTDAFPVARCTMQCYLGVGAAASVAAVACRLLPPGLFRCCHHRAAVLGVEWCGLVGGWAGNEIGSGSILLKGCIHHNGTSLGRSKGDSMMTRRSKHHGSVHNAITPTFCCQYREPRASRGCHTEQKDILALQRPVTPL